MREHPLPSNWRTATIGEIAAPVPNAIVDGPFGSNLKLSDYVEAGVPVLQGKNITKDTFQWFDVRFISDRKANELKRSSVRVGDILLVKIGSIGYSAVIRDLQGFDFAIIPANLAKITPNRAAVDTEYLHKWLTSVDAKRYLENAASKTAQPALSLGKIKSLPIPLPPMAEQLRIAEVLDQAEALRAKRVAALAQLDTLTQAIFVHLFGDPITNPNGWPVLRLEDALSMPLRNGLSPSHSGKVVGKVLSLSAITGSRFDASSWKTSTFQTPPPSEQAVDEIDFLICRGNGNVRLVGKGYFPTGRMPDVTFPDTMIAARVSPERIERAFLQHIWNSNVVRRQVESLARTTNGTFKVNQRMLEGIAFVAPPLNLQRVFAHRITAVEKLETSHRASMAELDALFAVLQHRAFRGEL
jgi:type I restriction enzyme S subunit